MLNEKHVSVDIEACGDVLLSIGACYFDPKTGDSQETFYGVLSVQPQLEAGLKMSGSAWEWWLTQSDEARSALRKPQSPVDVLFRFRDFMSIYGKPWPWMWAYPVSFDLPVMERVHRALCLDAPWKWTKTMDGRTLWRLACAVNGEAEKIERASADIPHHALEDAKEQARWYARYMKFLFPEGVPCEPQS